MNNITNKKDEKTERSFNLKLALVYGLLILLFISLVILL